MPKMKRILTVSLDKPAENVDVFSFDKDISISEIRREVRRHKNCRLSIRKTKAYMVCGR